MNCNLVTLMWL